MKNEAIEVRVDLHVHSSYSDSPYSWFLRSNHAAECYTAPRTVYETATRRGMNLVTITDHDTIAGALELASLYDNTFLSEEISARFPEDGCIVHTIALDITEAQHQEIQRLRSNIYELMRYMSQEEIVYFWCHPLSDVNHRLSKSHIERCLLMFRALEVRNGTRDGLHEDRLLDLTRRVTPSLLARWAEKYPMTPPLNLDGHYAFTGGSDDHGGIAIARAFTAFQGQPTGASLRAALLARATEPAGEAGEASTLAHNCYGVAAGYFRSSGQFGGGEGGKPSMSLLSVLASRKSKFEEQGGRLSMDELIELGHTDDYQNQLLRAVEPALIHGWRGAFEGLLGAMGGGRVAEAADGVAELIKSALMELPYVLAHRYHVRDRNKAARFHESFAFTQPDAEKLRVAVITDSIDEIDGVALGLRRLHAEANRWSLKLDLVAVGGCDRLTLDDDGIFRIPSVYDYRLPEYPQYAWSVPHLPSLLRYITENHVDLVQCSTPGPAGFAGLLGARLLGIPVIGQFHTDVPEYALRITGDPTVADLVRVLVSWFYRAMDRTLVPSDWVASLVRDLGVGAERISRVPRGIDLDLFSGAQRDMNALAELGINGEPKILYVGRISKEKGLRHLAEGFSALSRELPSARLVMVGDGPYVSELSRMLPEGKVVFTGPLTGERLARLYASCDVFAFPSETETFGNVVVEAQATGLPVVVAERGAARENMRDGVTGMVVDTRDPSAWCRSLKRLLEDAELRRQMSHAARELARRYSMGEAVRGTFQEYARILAEVGGKGAHAVQPGNA